MLKQVRKYCEERKLFSGESNVLVACSGGPDSMAMLDLLLHMKFDMGFRMAVAHFEHGIRGQDSLDDAKFVQEYCKERGIDCYMGSGNVPKVAKEQGISLETAAHNMRYRFLQDVSHQLGGALIATAHHRDDQAETVLMHILRGSGLTGLSGIRPKKDNIIRPVLFLSKEQLLDYCYINKIPAHMDRTNEIPDCTRNRIRLNLMPNLASSYNQAITEGLCHLAEIASIDGDYLHSETQRLFSHLVEERSGRFRIKRSDYLSVHVALQRRLLQLIIRKAAGYDVGKRPSALGLPTGSGNNVGYVHLRLLADFIENGKTGTKVSLPGDVQAFMDYGTLTIYKRTAEEANIFSSAQVPLIVPGITTCHSWSCDIKAERYEGHLPDEVITKIKSKKHHHMVVVDLDKCQGELHVRTRLPGDRLQLKAGSKKLKDFFIDSKLPRDEREKKALICDNRGIIWVAGMKKTKLSDIDNDTKHFLVLSCAERGL